MRDLYVSLRRSARSLRRAVALAKGEHRSGRRSYRPWVPAPGEHLVIDWGRTSIWRPGRALAGRGGGGVHVASTVSTTRWIPTEETA